MLSLVWQQAAAALAPACGAGTSVQTVLTGDQALGPIAWVAPEVLAGRLATGVIATPASDVYMLGGLMFEVLTCGRMPYFWINDMRLVAQVRKASPFQVAALAMARDPSSLSFVKGR